MTPNLADIHTAPLTVHYTTVVLVAGFGFAARCLCGWAGDRHGSASAAWTDARKHEDGAS